MADRWPPCPGKTPYPSRQSARRIACLVMTRRKRRLFTYFCKDCRAWHLTKADRPR